MQLGKKTTCAPFGPANAHQLCNPGNARSKVPQRETERHPRTLSQRKMFSSGLCNCDKMLREERRMNAVDGDLRRRETSFGSDCRSCEQLLASIQRCRKRSTLLRVGGRGSPLLVGCMPLEELAAQAGIEARPGALHVRVLSHLEFKTVQLGVEIVQMV